MTEEIISQLKIWLPTIVSVLLFFVSVLTSLISKNNGKTQVFKDLLESLPIFINDAESRGFNSGSSKLNYVVMLCVAKLSADLSISTDKVKKQYGDLIVDYVESILSTPKKKEVI